MEGKITIFIKNNKIYKGNDCEYNTVIIDREKLQDNEYKRCLIARIDRIAKHNFIEYKPSREKKTVEYVNNTPQGTGFSQAMIGIIKRNETARKQIEDLRKLLLQ